ncbi:hypothetical protein [Puniceicoccus vermicola]|uniref:Uncharacterized protein n=1 Tax=Puniceicoccus vermicola TaxID=388746 RepID=A0A7X1B2G4_9BACT|nr:hypothetical protein [Puniceicoccus vermicola]MBC2604424.1 hypothetical protein [Puniceicoccus vermicola]
MTTHIQYPRPEATAQSVFTQEMVDMATAHILSWRQAVGNFGTLLLHACWGESSSLQRRYHGQTAPGTYPRFQGMRALFDYTGDETWRWQADDIIANILFLQEPGGGFRHAANEGEPIYSSDPTCPIHQGLPLLTLVEYLDWSGALEERKPAVAEAIEKNLGFLARDWWKKGNVWSGPLPDAGFCGVTNQDLVVVAAMARHAQITGEDHFYKTYGKPTLDFFLSPRFYHENIGLFERGDKPNFTERTGYHDLVIRMLEITHHATGDERLPAVLDNVCNHLFDAVFTDSEGWTYFGWGAETDPDDKSYVKSWTRNPQVMTETPKLLLCLKDHLRRNPNPDQQKTFDKIEQTMAAYVFSDGSIPLTLNGDDDLFKVTSTPLQIWSYAIQYLGKKLKSPKRTQIPCIHRSTGRVSWRCNQDLWTIEVDGVRQFGGLKSNPSAVVIGPEETLAGADFDRLAEPSVIEKI